MSATAGHKSGTKFLYKLSYLFGFFSIFTFVPNPLFSNNEIIPYYGLLAILLLGFSLIAKRRLDSLTVRLLLSLFVLLFVSLLIENSTALMDIVAIFVILISLSAYRFMSGYQRHAFELGMWLSCRIAFILLILQMIFPVVTDLVYQYLTIRQGSAEHISSYSGGAIGFAPEPAYMASFLLGPYAYFLFLGKQHLRKTVVIAASILLTGSLSGVMLMFIVTLILEFKYFFRTTRGNLYIVLMIAMLTLVSILNERIFDRIGGLIEILLLEGLSVNTLQVIDLTFGSNRLRTLVAPLSSICCGVIFAEDYLSPYSFFATLFYLIAPLHIAFVLLIIPRRKYTRLFFVALFLAVFSGPLLNWLAYLGFVYYEKKTENGYI
ncbi:MAG: hypothetical protein P1V33_04160 [Pseudohongiella nitratireducens]|nr:hypothetical protein [Pseudohongiella nitratireducens]MDF1622650.1 hypothetical protein [Pseudohongiella nitratireducens]